MNRYDIASILAEGAQGRVYRATDRITGQSCVLKTGETVRAEAFLALQLSHPYIARPFDAGIDSSLGQYAAYPEYTETPILDWSKSSSPAELQRVALQIAEFLAFLHRRGWLYHDFKPQHFLVARQSIRVLDLGLAQRIQETSQTFSGTFPYIAPERLAGRKCDARSDIFALGMLLLHVLQPDETWDFEPSVEVLQSLQKRTRKLTGFWKDLLSEMISLEPAQRIESAAELWKRLLPSNARNSFLFFYVPPDLETPIDALRTRQIISFQTPSNLNVSEIERIVLEQSWKEGIHTVTFDLRNTTPQELFSKLCCAENNAQPGDLFSAIEYLQNAKQSDHYTLVIRYPEMLPVTQRALLSYALIALQKVSTLRFVLVGNKHVVDITEESATRIDVPPLTKKSVSNILTDGFPAAGAGVIRFEKIISKGYSLPEQVLADLRKQLPQRSFLSWPAAARDLAPPAGLERLRATEMRVLGSLAIVATPIHRDWLFQALRLKNDQGMEWIEGLQTKGLVQNQNYLVSLTIISQPVLNRLRKDRLKKLADALLQSIPATIDQELTYKVAKAAGRKRIGALMAIRMARQERFASDTGMAWYLKAFLAGARLPKSTLYHIVKFCLRTGHIKQSKRILRTIRSLLGKSLWLGVHWINLYWRTGDYKALEKLADKLAVIAKRKGFRRYDYYFQMRKAASLILLNKYNEAESILSRLQEVIEPDSDEKLTGLLNHYLGILCFFKGQLNDALIFGRHSVTFNHPFKGSSFMNLGIFLGRLGQYEEAEKWLSKSIIVFQKQNDLERLSFAFGTLGIIVKRKGKLREARAFYCKSLHLSRSYGNNILILSTLNNISESYEIEGRLGQALTIVKKAISMGRQSKSEHLLAFSLTQAGRLLAIRGEFRKGISCLMEAIGLLTRMQARADLATAYETLGIAYYLSGHDSTGKNNFQKALELYVKGSLKIDGLRANLFISLATNDPVRLMNSHNDLPPESFELGIYHLLMAKHFLPSSKHNCDKARNHLNVAERIFRKIPSLFWLGIALKHKTELYIQTDHLEKARTCLESAHNIFLRLGSKKELFALSRVQQVIKEPSDQINKMPEGLPYKVLLMVRDVLSANDPNSMISRILSTALEFTSMERAVLILSEEDPPRIFKSATLDTNTVQEIREISRSALEETIEARKPYQRLNTVSDKLLQSKPSIIANRIQSILCLPLRSENKNIGVLYLDSKEGIDTVAPTESLLLEVFANVIALVLEEALELENSKNENKILKCSLSKDVPSEIIGNGSAIQSVRAKIQKLSSGTHPILISGETGTGKELVAQLLHASGKGNSSPFVAFNCASFCEGLLETELFGREKGAFTSADSVKKGLLEEAEDGTMFLDEIADLPFSLQAKLLRVLQEGEFRRVGGNTLLRTDARFIFATNKNLLDLVNHGQFREDLYYRIAGLEIDVLPLRQRKEDIATLAGYFLKSIQIGKKKRLLGFTTESIKLMEEYSWPGNVRQLRNEIQRIATFAEHRIIEPTDFSLEISKSGRNDAAAHRQTLRAIEQEIIQQRLSECNWNIARTAKTLGITRHGLYNKMRIYNIRRAKTKVTKGMSSSKSISLSTGLLQIS